MKRWTKSGSRAEWLNKVKLKERGWVTIKALADKEMCLVSQEGATHHWQSRNMNYDFILYYKTFISEK